jgi:hypothetical protein
MAAVLQRASPEASFEACLAAALWLEHREDARRVLRATYHTDDLAEIDRIRTVLRLSLELGKQCSIS